MFMKFHLILCITLFRNNKLPRSKLLTSFPMQKQSIEISKPIIKDFNLCTCKNIQYQNFDIGSKNFKNNSIKI